MVDSDDDFFDAQQEFPIHPVSALDQGDVSVDLKNPPGCTKAREVLNQPTEPDRTETTKCSTATSVSADASVSALQDFLTTDRRPTTESQAQERLPEGAQFLLKDQDTGKMYDLRELDAHLPTDQYDSFFPLNVESSSADVDRQDSVDRSTKSGAKIRFGFSRRKSKADVSLPSGSREENFIPVYAHNNKDHHREFPGVQVVQKLTQHQGPIWAMKFSHDGLYLASAGQDTVIRVFQVIAHMGDNRPSRTEHGLFQPVPTKVFEGHTLPVIDLSWSRSHFLLSASMDKTVRLWHISRLDCLHIFQHPDSVPAVDFHPKEDRSFVSGCFDNKVRVWDIPEGKVTSWAQTPVMITAVTFNPSGTMAIVGLVNGQCTFYLAHEHLNYYTQIECRNAHGPLKGGRKVTGIDFTPEGQHFLVTTNDSRMRLYRMEDFARIFKYKGLMNENLQIQGSFSQDGNHVICGSENGQVLMWKTIRGSAEGRCTGEHVETSRSSSTRKTSSFMQRVHHLELGHQKLDRNSSYEYFQASSSSSSSSSPPGISTVALFAPASTFALYQASADPASARGTGISNIHQKASTQLMVVANYAGEIKVFQVTAADDDS